VTRSAAAEAFISDVIRRREIGEAALAVLGSLRIARSVGIETARGHAELSAAGHAMMRLGQSGGSSES